MIYSNRAVSDGVGGELAAAVGKSTPPVAVASAVVLGQTLEDWIVILTVTFLVLQIAYLLYRFGRDLLGKGGRGDG